MQKLVSLALASLLISQTALADCSDAIEAADTVIEKQDALIQLDTKRIGELTDENQRLTKSLVEMKDVTDSALSKQITYGVIGVILGAAAMALVKK